jgi:hypothetical protein
MLKRKYKLAALIGTALLTIAYSYVAGLIPKPSNILHGLLISLATIAAALVYSVPIPIYVLGPLLIITGIAIYRFIMSKLVLERQIKKALNPDWYIQDYFFGAVWKWRYRPEMGDGVPRDIQPCCPECDKPLEPLTSGTIYFMANGTVSQGGYRLRCPMHPREYQIPGDESFANIVRLIQEKRENGKWKELVERQIKVMRENSC